MITIDQKDQFAVQNWTVVPIENPNNTTNQTLMVLSGVGVLTVRGHVPGDWAHETIVINPKLDEAIHYAIENYWSRRFPALLEEEILRAHAFRVNQWTIFGAATSVECLGGDAGFAVDTWRLAGGNTVGQYFAGIELDVALRNSTVLYRVSYHVTLAGEIVDLSPGSEQEPPFIIG